MTIGEDRNSDQYSNINIKFLLEVSQAATGEAKDWKLSLLTHWLLVAGPNLHLDACLLASGSYHQSCSWVFGFQVWFGNHRLRGATWIRRSTIWLVFRLSPFLLCFGSFVCFCLRVFILYKLMWNVALICSYELYEPFWHKDLDQNILGARPGSEPATSTLAHPKVNQLTR